MSEELLLIKTIKITNGRPKKWRKCQKANEKEFEKVNQTDLRIWKIVVKKKDHNSYVKCKGFDNSCNCWGDKK